MTVLHRLLRNTWQRKFESTLLPEPEVYKRHAFVIKGANDRLVLLSDLWFSNVEVTYKPTTVKSVKVRASQHHCAAQHRRATGGAVWARARFALLCLGRSYRLDSMCMH